MKLNGIKLDTPNEETVVIPRGEGDPIVFKCRAVLSFERFEQLYPEVEAPKMQAAGSNKWVEDTEDEEYKGKVAKRNTAEFNWMIYQSVTATPGLEFETVKDSDPDSWDNIQQEFRGAGFSQVEINRIVQGVLQANCLDEGRLDEARKSFILSQAQQQSD